MAALAYQMDDIQQHTDFGALPELFELNKSELAAIAQLLDKLPHKLNTRITDINEDEVVIRTQLYDQMFTIVYSRQVTNEYKWVMCTAKKIPTCASTYQEVELFINMYNKYF
jgi:hypothetical protein